MKISDETVAAARKAYFDNGCNDFGECIRAALETALEPAMAEAHQAGRAAERLDIVTYAYGEYDKESALEFQQGLHQGYAANEPDWQRAERVRELGEMPAASLRSTTANSDERARALAILVELVAAAENRQPGHQATPWLQAAKQAVEGGEDPRVIAAQKGPADVEG